MVTVQAKVRKQSPTSKGIIFPPGFVRQARTLFNYKYALLFAGSEVLTHNNSLKHSLEQSFMRGFYSALCAKCGFPEAEHISAPRRKKQAIPVMQWRIQLCRNDQRLGQTSHALFFIAPDTTCVLLILTDLLEILLDQEIPVFSKRYYCGWEGGVCFLKCFQVELKRKGKEGTSVPGYAVDKDAFYILLSFARF